jgi:hypothetical protein
MNLYLLGGAFLAGVALVCGVAWGGYEWGADSVRSANLAKELTQAQKVVVRQQILERQVPTIVTKYVQTTTTVEVSHETLVKEIADVLDEHCVMPHGFAELLVAFANSRDGQLPDPQAVARYAGIYGCRETAKAIADDLRAGFLNTARLEGLQGYVKAKQLAEKETQ